MTKYISNPPIVSKQWDAERSKGYTFATSVADLVDNSIGEGKATRIHMSFEVLASGDLTFYLADNGVGMNKEKLFSAMTGGSSSDVPKHELSKFGYGMKTASWAHARRLVVVSRPAGDIDNPCGAAWDGDHIKEVNEWQMEELESIPNAYLEYLDDLDGKVSGTIVVWEKIDRLLHDYKDPMGKHRLKALTAHLEDLKEHLGLVFHRFLDKEYSGAPNIEIFVNEKAVQPWDPFAEKYGNYEKPTLTQLLKFEGRRPIVVTPYLLPREDSWSHEEPYKKVIKKANELQGFYLYRANRLLQEPNWLRLGKQEPHSNLARVKVDINPDWDEDLHVDVKKAHVVFPPAQLDELIRIKAGITGLADKQRRDTDKPTNSGTSHIVGSAAIDRQKNLIARSTVSVVDSENQLATITNEHGQLSGVRVVEPAPGLPVNVLVSDTGLEDGQLWDIIVATGNSTEPSLQLSGRHEFYRRAYLPASTSQTAKTALDMIFWALAQAEMNQANDTTKKMFVEFRFELARTLRLLSQELPEIDDESPISE